MFTIAEIAKTFITEHFTPLTSWVYSKQITLTQAEIDSSYWVAWGGTIDYNQEAKSISSVYLDYTLNLAEMDNLVDCQGQEESFFFDSINQILYIHVTHTENPFAQTIETGLLFGYCSDKVRYFGNQEYKPILQSIPTISQSADPLQYDIMAFSGGSVVLSNDGEFDTFEKLYGNTIRLKIGKDGDDYTDLITIFNGYIKDYTTTTKDITIDIGDNREKLQIEYPTQVFDTLTGLAEDSNGTIIPDGYGNVIQVPAYPIEINATQVTYQWGTLVTSISQLYAIRDEVAIEVGHGDWYLPSKDELNLLYTELHVNGLGSFSATNDYWSATEIDSSNAWRQYFGNGGQASTDKTTSCKIRPVRAFTSTHTYIVGQPSPSGGFIFSVSGSNYKECAPNDIGSDTWANAVSLADDYDTILNFSTNGTFDLLNSTAYIDGNNAKGLRKVYVTGVMRNLTNPADIIVDLNARLANIQYNSTNYNLTEWEAEKTALADVSLYMDDSKSLYDWISLLQSGSTWGFRYEDSGKRTIRRDDPDRATITFDDGTTIITPVEIRNSDIPIDQNAELYATSCIVKYGYNHRTQSYSQVENTDYKDAVLQEHRIEKILTIESLLTNKTDAEAKALRIMQDQSKVRPIITLKLEVSKCTTPRIYDMIEAQVSLLTRETRIPSVWSYVLGDMDILGDLGVIGEVHKLTRTEAYTRNGSRLYFGELKGQIIGIEPRTDTDSVVLRIRERD